MKTSKLLSVLSAIIIILASCSTPPERIIKYTTNDNCKIEFKEGCFGDAKLVSNEFSEDENCFLAVFDKEVKEIDEAAFEKSLITSIEIPNSVTSIGEKAFYDCSGLTSITIPGNVKNIGDFCFARCGLMSVCFSEGVESIGFCAFLLCENLESVKIPMSMTNIGGRAFQECYKLRHVDIPNKNAVIGENAFQFNSLIDFLKTRGY